MNTELTKVETALVEFDKIEAGLADLRGKYADVVYPVATKDGMREALAARAAIRKPRYATEEIRKGAKAPILALGRDLDSKAKYINAELLKIEEPIQAQIAAEEDRKEREVRAENMRVAAITQAISDLHMIVSSMSGKSSHEITKRIADIQEYDLTEWAEEFIPQAEKARAAAVAGLQQLHAGAFAQEQAAAAEAKRIADERADFERRKAALEEQEKAQAARISQEAAERAKVEAEAKAKRDEAERASRATIEAQEREARQAREKADAEAKALREAEEARLKAERDKVEAARRAIEEAQRKEREAAEAIERAKRQAAEAEQRRIEQQKNDILDGRAMLQKFVDRFGHLGEFKVIADLIDDFLREEKRKAA